MDLKLGATEYAIFVFSTVCHEMAHAWAAQKGGDDTAARGGQNSLDPIPHIRREPIGMVAIPLLSLFTGGYLIGWASTPYDSRWAAYYPKRAAWMALAGPLANLGLVLYAAAAIHLGILAGYLHQSSSIRFETVAYGVGADWTIGLGIFLSVLFSLNLLLFFFNLIPLPPMDGAGAIALLPGGEGLSRFLRSPQLRMMGMLVAFFGFRYIYGPLQVLSLNLLFPGSHYH